MTVLDKAHAAMEAGGDGQRLRFYDRLADAELKLLLEREAEGDRIAPRIFPLEDGPVVLVFDTEERLAEAAGAAPYADLTGRALIEMLAGQGIGLGLNLGVAPSAFLMGADAIDWLAETLGDRPEERQAQPREIAPPAAVPEALLAALDAKLPGLAGLAQHAWLAAVTYADGRRGHLLAFTGALPGAEPALARAIREALVFSGLEAGELDVTTLSETDPLADRLSRVALRFDLPQPEPAQTPSSPGMDPDRPPRLR